MTTSASYRRPQYSGSLFGSDVIGAAVTIGAVAAGAAIIEAALVPGLLIGGAAILAPRLLPRNILSGFGEKLRWSTTTTTPLAAETKSTTTDPVPVTIQPQFNTRRAVVKTLTYRVIVTTVDFGANYFVIGTFATAAGLSGLSLVVGPVFYFFHEAVWHYYGPASARLSNPLEATVQLPIRAAASANAGSMQFPEIRVSRAFAKTATYEVVTAVSEFGANFIFVRDLATAAGLTAFSVAISPLIYYVHEKAWDYYDAKTLGSAATEQQTGP